MSGRPDSQAGTPPADHPASTTTGGAEPAMDPAAPAGGRPPDYVVLGHLTLDRLPAGHALGGTTAYAALTAQRLGRRAAIVTAGAPDEAKALRRHGILIASAPSPAPTIFENLYRDGRRQQFLRSRAADVSADAIPAAWRAAPVAHLAPLTQELDPAIAAAFPRALVGVTPQGWLRRWDAEGRVSSTPWQQAADALTRVDALVFSEQDVDEDEALIERYVGMARLAVVTRGAAGCVVYTEGRSCALPAYPAREVEPTGAGDVFAAAFFLRFAETQDPCAAADWANCVASFAVEAPGTAGIPTLDQVQERLARGTG